MIKSTFELKQPAFSFPIFPSPDTMQSQQNLVPAMLDASPSLPLRLLTASAQSADPSWDAAWIKAVWTPRSVSFVYWLLAAPNSPRFARPLDDSNSRPIPNEPTAYQVGSYVTAASFHGGYYEQPYDDDWSAESLTDCAKAPRNEFEPALLDLRQEFNENNGSSIGISADEWG